MVDVFGNVKHRCLNLFCYITFEMFNKIDFVFLNYLTLL